MQARARCAARAAVSEHPKAPHRLRNCGHLRYQKHVDVLRSGSARYYVGVCRCRSRMCPVCWIARRAQLAHEITYVVAARGAATRRVPLLATFTIRHGARDPLSICRTVRDCWRAFISGREWVWMRNRFGLQWIAAEEMTLGEHGWHPHVHVLLLPERAIDPEELEELSGWCFERWYELVARAFGEQGIDPFDHDAIARSHLPSLEHGVDLRPCGSAGYLSKLGLQMTDSGAVKGRSPITLLELGELDSYVELQLSRHRAKDVTWSKGLRELRDSVPASADPQLVLQLRGAEFERLKHAGGDDALLDVLEAEDPAFVATWWIGPLAGAGELEPLS